MIDAGRLGPLANNVRAFHNGLPVLRRNQVNHASAIARLALTAATSPGGGPGLRSSPAWKGPTARRPSLAQVQGGYFAPAFSFRNAIAASMSFASTRVIPLGPTWLS